MAGHKPQELLDQLEKIAKTCRNGVAGLLIAYPKTTKLLYNSHDDKLEFLTLALRSGGKPLAWFGIYEDGLRLSLLPEYRGKEWAHRCLERIGRAMSSKNFNRPSNDTSN